MEEMIEKLRQFKTAQEANLEKGEIILDICYYGKITLSVNNSGLSNEKEEDLYLIKKEINGVTGLEFKTDSGIIATILGNGEIRISEEYKHLIRKEEFLLQLKSIIPLSLEELEKEHSNKEKTAKISKTDGKEKTSQTEEQIEESRERDTPKKYVENPKVAKIDPNRKITKTKTFYDLVPEAKEKEVVDVVVRSKDNLTFEFIGINSAGKEIHLKTLEKTEGTNPNKDIVEINADGSSIRKDQVSTMLKIRNGQNEGKQNEGFTIKLGKYGIPEISYYRRSSELSQYSSIPVNLENTNQKITDTDVREYMERPLNTTTDDNIKRAEDRINNNKGKETQLENIDDNPYNDIEDSSEIQIKKAAKRCKISVEEFKQELKKQHGDTLDERIENAENAINEEFRGRNRR